MNHMVCLLDTSTPQVDCPWQSTADALTGNSRWTSLREELLSIIDSNDLPNVRIDISMSHSVEYRDLTTTNLTVPSTTTRQICNQLLLLRHAVNDTTKPCKTLCELLQQGLTFLLQDSLMGSTNTVKGRVVLFTCGQDIVLTNEDLQQVLVWIDKIREHDFRLYVFGLDFSKTIEFTGQVSPPPDKESSLGDIDESSLTGEQEDCSSSSDEEEANDDLSDQQPLVFSREEMEAFLASIVEKTGGRIIAIKNQQELRTELQNLFSTHNHMREEEVHDRPAKKRVIVAPDTPIIGWMRWNETSKTSIEEFVENNLPDSTSPQTCSWIAVDNACKSSPGYKGQHEPTSFKSEPFLECLEPIEDLINSNMKVPARVKKLAIDKMNKVAASQNSLVGKWMIRFEQHEGVVDDAWRKIALATAQGKLGCSSKINPSRPGNVSVCCIYVKDFCDKQEIQRVRLELDRMDLPGQHCGFKPDYYTYLGIYINNKWRLPPTMFSVQEVRKWTFNQ